MSIEQKIPVNNSSLDPQALVLEKDRAYFREHGMVAYEIGSWPLELDVSKMKPLEKYDKIALLGVLDAGGVAVQLYSRTDETGALKQPVLSVGLASGDQNLRTDGRSQEAIDRQYAGVFPKVMSVERGHAPRVFGRSHADAGALGLTDQHVSREHFGVTLFPNGTLKVEDYSANGTRLITGAPETNSAAKAKLSVKAKQWLGGKVAKKA